LLEFGTCIVPHPTMEISLLIFEGSEKKADIYIDATKLSFLKDFDDDFWHNLVKQCGAKILSSIENEHCKAFLLSESSLFVWHNRLLIITCGLTQLIKSVEFLLLHIDKQALEQVIYQRKNEYFAPAQFTSFGEDIHQLEQYCAGKAFRFGALDTHHNYIFHSEHNSLKNLEKYKSSNNLAPNKTYEIVAYQICSDASEHLTTENLSNHNIRDYLQLTTLLPDFIFDDFVFEPYGYSINAIKGDDYFTIHVTPQADSSYVSFCSSLNLISMAAKILAILKPRSFDLLSINENSFAEQVTNLLHSTQYLCQTSVAKQFSNKHQVNFTTYILPNLTTEEPIELTTNSQNNTL